MVVGWLVLVVVGWLVLVVGGWWLVVGGCWLLVVVVVAVGGGGGGGGGGRCGLMIDDSIIDGFAGHNHKNETDKDLPRHHSSIFVPFRISL